MIASLSNLNDEKLEGDSNEQNPQQRSDKVQSLAELVKQKQEETFMSYIKNLKEIKPPLHEKASLLEDSVKVNIPQQKIFRMFLHAVVSGSEEEKKECDLVVYEDKMDDNFVNFIKLSATQIILGLHPKITLNYRAAPPFETKPVFSQEILVEDIVYFVRFLGLGKYPFAYDGKRFSTNQVLIDLVRQAQQIVSDAQNKRANPKVHLKFNSNVFKTIDGSLGQEYIKGLFQVLGLGVYGDEFIHRIVDIIISNGKMIPQKDRLVVLQRFVSGKRHSPAQILSVCTKIERAAVRHTLQLTEENIVKLCDNFKKVIDKLKLNPSDQNLINRDKQIRDLMNKIPFPAYACFYARIRARNQIIRGRKSENLLLWTNQKKSQDEIQKLLKSQRVNITLNDLFKRMTAEQCSPLHINPYHVALICYANPDHYDDILATSSNTAYYFIDSNGVYRPNVQYLQYVGASSPEKSLKEAADKEIKYITEKVDNLVKIQNIASFELQQNKADQQSVLNQQLPTRQRRGGARGGGVSGSNRGGKFQSGPLRRDSKDNKENDID